MEGLLTEIVLWLSANFPLRANVNHPSIKFVSAAEMIADDHRRIQVVLCHYSPLYSLQR
jgi:hypothetical protein